MSCFHLPVDIEEKARAEGLLLCRCECLGAPAVQSVGVCGVVGCVIVHSDAIRAYRLRPSLQSFSIYGLEASLVHICRAILWAAGHDVDLWVPPTHTVE